MRRIGWMTLIVLAALAGVSPLRAQTVGTTAVTGLQSLCDPYLAGTPFADAALGAGFGYDSETMEYYFGPEEELLAQDPAGDPGCGLTVLHTPAELAEITASIRALAESRGMVLETEREYVVDAQAQMWGTRWASASEYLLLVEMKALDGQSLFQDYEGLRLHLEKR